MKRQCFNTAIVKNCGNEIMNKKNYNVELIFLILFIHFGPILTENVAQGVF